MIAQRQFAGCVSRKMQLCESAHLLLLLAFGEWPRSGGTAGFSDHARCTALRQAEIRSEIPQDLDIWPNPPPRRFYAFLCDADRDFLSRPVFRSISSVDFFFDLYGRQCRQLKSLLGVRRGAPQSTHRVACRPCALAARTTARRQRRTRQPRGRQSPDM